MDNHSLRDNIIIQCRDESTRMKHKAVRPFYDGKSILEIIIDKFQLIGDNIVVATTPYSYKTIEICKRLGVEDIWGPIDNVTARVAMAANISKFDNFFRVCADNPFVSLPLMYPLEVYKENYDYIAFKGCMQRHEGFWMEYIKTNVLWKILDTTKEIYNLEHVTPFIYNNPQIFKTRILPVPNSLNEHSIRLTVDTMDDFKLAQKIYNKFGEQYWGHIVAYIIDHPKIERQMKKNIEANMK